MDLTKLLPIHRVTTLHVIRLGLLAGLLVALSGPWIGKWLVVNQRPQKSDAIIVLGGGPMNRLRRGAFLFHKGYADYLILSGGALDIEQATQAQVMGWQATTQFSIPADRILEDNRSQSTYQNALFSRVIMMKHHWTSALVVSSNYHMRRVSFIFSHVFKSPRTRLTYVAAGDPYFNPAWWWANPQSAAITVSEYIKLCVNVLQFYALKIP